LFADLFSGMVSSPQEPQSGSSRRRQGSSGASTTGRGRGRGRGSVPGDGAPARTENSARTSQSAAGRAAAAGAMGASNNNNSSAAVGQYQTVLTGTPAFVADAERCAGNLRYSVYILSIEVHTACLKVHTACPHSGRYGTLPPLR
jgi:hypothetical protein